MAACDKGYDLDDVLADLEADRASGVLAEIVTGSAVRYGVDPSGKIVAVDAQGKSLDE